MNRVERLFDDLLESGRNWGVLVDPIIASYLVLPKLEREAVRNKVSVQKRFVLFSQHNAEFRRCLAQWDENCPKDHLRELLILLAIEDYQYDYRETLLRLKGAIDGARNRLAWGEIVKAWQDVRPLCSLQSVRRTESQFKLWYPDSPVGIGVL